MYVRWKSRPSLDRLAWLTAWLSQTWTWIVSRPNLNADGGRSTSSLLVHLLLNLTLVHSVIGAPCGGGKWRETFPLKLHNRIPFIHSKMKRIESIHRSEKISTIKNNEKLNESLQENHPFCARCCAIFCFVFTSAGVVSCTEKSYSRCRS